MQPLVSVRIITYNHEKYIEQCLEGILMQHTDFAFEIVIGEHTSADRTQEIVLAYQEKYPDKIRVLNAGREISPIQNAMRVQQACRGKYHALCEGDDYWIDPLKLQKQVDFLETHPQVTMCFHNAFVTRQDIFASRFYFAAAMKEILDYEDVYLLSLPTGSLMGRCSVLSTLPEWRANIINGDRLLRLWCAHHGPLGYLADVMSVYRKHAGVMSHKTGKSRQEWYVSTVYMCQEFDKTTNYQHTALMQKFIKQAKEYCQRSRWGRIYYLLHPNQSKAKLERIYQAIKRR
jgi:glycosyltransferase involved in cell wall biosynthesis